MERGTFLARELQMVGVHGSLTAAGFNLSKDGRYWVYSGEICKAGGFSLDGNMLHRVLPK